MRRYDPPELCYENLERGTPYVDLRNTARRFPNKAPRTPRAGRRRRTEDRRIRNKSIGIPNISEGDPNAALGGRLFPPGFRNRVSRLRVALPRLGGSRRGSVVVSRGWRRWRGCQGGPRLELDVGVA